MKRTHTLSSQEGVYKRLRSTPTKIEFTDSGLCISCQEYHGVVENNGKCSHCYNPKGPNVYKTIAMRHLHLMDMEEKFNTHYGTTLDAIQMLLKIVQKHSTLCVHQLIPILWTDQFFGKNIFLNAVQAHYLYKHIQEMNLRVCNRQGLELHIFLNVYDYWNLDTSELLFYCSSHCHTRHPANDFDSAVKEMDRIKEVLLASTCHNVQSNME